MNEPTLTITGFLGGDPDLRFTPSGAAVVNFSVATTPRSYNKQTGQWEDGVTIWTRCTAWRGLAEAVGSQLAKGSRVIVAGRLAGRQWTDKDGQSRTQTVLEVEEVGLALKRGGNPVTTAGNTAPDQQGGAWGQANEPPF